MSKEVVKQEENKSPAKKEMSFLNHLEELRWHILRSIAAIFAIGIVVFILDEITFGVIMAPKDPSFPTYRLLCAISEMTCMIPTDFQLIVRDMGEQFFTHIKVSIWVGLVIAFPYVFWEFWRFVKPGLYSNERKAARGMVAICSALFLFGVLFGYFVISPFTITFLTGYQVTEDAINSPTLASYVNYLTMITIPTGIIFELPIVVYFLAKIGLISSAFMEKYRRHAFVIVFILAAIITPPDIITQVLIGVPIYLLYEVSIMIVKRIEAKEAEED